MLLTGGTRATMSIEFYFIFFHTRSIQCMKSIFIGGKIKRSEFKTDWKFLEPHQSSILNDLDWESCVCVPPHIHPPAKKSKARSGSDELLTFLLVVKTFWRLDWTWLLSMNQKHPSQRIYPKQQETALHKTTWIFGLILNTGPLRLRRINFRVLGFHTRGPEL